MAERLQNNFGKVCPVVTFSPRRTLRLSATARCPFSQTGVKMTQRSCFPSPQDDTMNKREISPGASAKVESPDDGLPDTAELGPLCRHRPRTANRRAVFLGPDRRGSPTLSARILVLKPGKVRPPARSASRTGRVAAATDKLSCASMTIFWRIASSVSKDRPSRAESISVTSSRCC